MASFTQLKTTRHKLDTDKIDTLLVFTICMRLVLFSPAKVNETLKVKRHLRKDGYHNIETNMTAISLGDTITMEIISENFDTLTCSDPLVPTDHRNLVIKALNIYRSYLAEPVFFHIHIEKRIPMGAGLGGGSSNAATAIFGANVLMKHKLPKNTLVNIGARTGSDVAFFLKSNGSAFCKGRGERVRGIRQSEKAIFVLVQTGMFCNTEHVYKAFDKFVEKRKYVGGVNNLERPACSCYPALKEIINSLPAGFIMTGSGSSFIKKVDLNECEDLIRTLTKTLPHVKVFKAVSVCKMNCFGWFRLTK